MSLLSSAALATRSPELASRSERPVPAPPSAVADDLAAFRQLRHHTKNALQRILCEIARAAEAEDTPRARAVFADLERRVAMSARISDALFGFTETPAPLATRLRSLCHAMVAALSASGQDVMWDVAVSGHCPEPHAATILRVAHEMLGNALRHGLAGRARGRVSVRVTRGARTTRLVVSDDGVGLRDRGGAGQGSRLMDELAGEHGGTVTLWRRGLLTIAELELPRA